jgi:outer membrane protein TolC
MAPARHRSRVLRSRRWGFALSIALTGVVGCASDALWDPESSPSPPGISQPLNRTAADVPPVVAKPNVNSPPRTEPIQQVQQTDRPGVAAESSRAENPADCRFPLDLATALRLAGANNLQIALAQERIRQAEARRDAAAVLWLPSLQGGAGYNQHRGLIQDTTGNIVDATRQSVFVGGGPNLGPGTLTGGDGSARLFVGVPLCDVFFAPLAERQTVRAANAARTATFNDTLLQVSLSYLELLRAQGQAAVAQDAVKNATELARLVGGRVQAGTAMAADGFRADAELADRKRQEFQTQEAVQTASAELARLLRLDPALTLLPAETQPVAVDLVDCDGALPDLIAQGLTSRPELAQSQALIQSSLLRLKQEKWRPLIPTVQVGYSGGGYGGGVGTDFSTFGSRGDFDALLVWELKNLGFGNRAQWRQQESQYNQARLTAEELRDEIVAEIVKAYHQVRFRRQQIEAAQAQVKAASEALPLNFKGILDGVLHAIEAQQAVQALAAAQSQYLNAVIEYDRAQFQLLRALGRPPASPAGYSDPGL